MTQQPPPFLSMVHALASSCELWNGSRSAATCARNSPAHCAGVHCWICRRCSLRRSTSSWSCCVDIFLFFARFMFEKNPRRWRGSAGVHSWTVAALIWSAGLWFVNYAVFLIRNFIGFFSRGVADTVTCIIWVIEGFVCAVKVFCVYVREESPATLMRFCRNTQWDWNRSCIIIFNVKCQFMQSFF